MIIYRKNPFGSDVRTMDIPVTDKQLADWESGTLIQRAMPNLSAAQREFILNGTTDADWSAFGEEEKDDEP